MATTDRPQHPPHPREELAILDRLWDVEERADALQDIVHADYRAVEARLNRIEQVLFGSTQSTPTSIEPARLHGGPPADTVRGGAGVTDRR